MRFLLIGSDTNPRLLEAISDFRQFIDQQSNYHHSK